MLMFYNICNCISISMKKMSFCQEPMHVYVHAEANASLIKINEFPGMLSRRCPLCLPESHICHVTDKGPSPLPISFYRRLLRPF